MGGGHSFILGGLRLRVGGTKFEWLGLGSLVNSWLTIVVGLLLLSNAIA